VLIAAWSVAWLLCRAGIAKEGKRSARLAALVAASAALIPIRGLSLSDLALSANPVFSVGSTALFLALLWKLTTGRRLLLKRDMILFSAWNLALSIPLYSSALGFIGYDLYAPGYGSKGLFVFILAVTVVLAAYRSRLAYIFLAYIAAFDLGLLQSGNFFDYIIDGVLFLASLITLASAAIKPALRKQTAA
jgi:hypothetical protein